MRRQSLPLLLAALAATACTEQQSNDPETPATATESAGEACPGVDDPECTTNNGCAPEELCSMCECVPKPAGCDIPEPDCISDADCGQLETCETCLCASVCDEDSACRNDAGCSPGETCEEVIEGICECELPGEADTGTETGVGTDTSTNPECASGEASPVDSVGDTTNEIVVFGTTLQGDLSGEPGACLGSLCDMTITSTHPSTVQWNVFGVSPADGVVLTSGTGDIEPGATVTLSLESTQCNMPSDEMRGISFFDVTETLELGIVDLRFVTALP